VTKIRIRNLVTKDRPLGYAATAEIEVERANADRQPVMHIASPEPSEHTTHEDTNEADTPEPDYSKNCGRLNFVLDEPEGLQYIPKHLRSEKTHRTEQGEVSHYQTGQAAQK
jgi:hypothetical protein